MPEVESRVRTKKTPDIEAKSGNLLQLCSLSGYFHLLISVPLLSIFSQNLMNQIIELERHFNALELNKFGDTGRVSMGQRAFHSTSKSSRYESYLIFPRTVYCHLLTFMVSQKWVRLDLKTSSIDPEPEPSTELLMAGFWGQKNEKARICLSQKNCYHLIGHGWKMCSALYEGNKKHSSII